MVQRHGHVVVHCIDNATGTVQFDVQRSAAKGDDPQEATQRWNDQCRQQELTDSTATGNTGDKQTNQRAPGQPPAPVENGPPALPLTFRVRIGPETHWNHVPQVVANAGRHQTQQVDGWAGNHKEADQNQAQANVPHAQKTDAALQTTHGGQRGNHSNTGNQQNLGGFRDFNAKQVVEARVHLRNAKTQCRGGTKQGTENRQQVDRMTGRAVDFVTQNRIQSRANGHRQTATAGKVGDHQTNDDVDSPTMQTPVEQGNAQSNLSRFRSTGGNARHFNKGVTLEVVDRLGDAPEQNANTNGAAEQHGEPGEETELRFFIVGTQLDVAVAAERHPDREEQHHTHHGHVVPVQCGLNPAFDVAVDPVGKIHVENGKEYKCQNHGFCSNTHPLVNASEHPVAN